MGSVDGPLGELEPNSAVRKSLALTLIARVRDVVLFWSHEYFLDSVW
jgi:hypothetical protein